ncbi:MAG: CAP domain-containing protein [Chloroflexi bacterium]|nr:CAP domain-containing protein [Chloroflexota bacterium]
MTGRRSLLAASALLGFLALALAALSPGGPNRAFALVNCDTATAGIDAQEQQLLVLINEARAASGAVALKFSPNLNRAAAWKSADSSASGSGFSHTDSLGRTLGPRLRDCGYAGTGAGENILWGTSDPRTAFDMWMDSSGHRANILTAAYRVIGIGRVGGNWTTDFGVYDDSAAADTPTTAPPPTPTPTPTVAPTPPPVFQASLAAGLNLITYSGPPQPPPPALASLGAKLVALYAWDPAFGWRRYLPGLPDYVSNLSQLQTGAAYFLELSGPATWSY